MKKLGLVFSLSMASMLALAGCPERTTNGDSPAGASEETKTMEAGTNGEPSMTTGTSEGAVLDRHPGVKAVRVEVTAKGFEPKSVAATRGKPLAIEFVRTAEKTCATEAIFDDLGGLRVDLPLNEPKRVSFTPEKSGEMKYGCAMGRMIWAQVEVSG